MIPIINKIMDKKTPDDFTKDMDKLLTKYNVKGYIAITGSDINMKFRDDMVLREICHIMNTMAYLTAEKDRARLLKHMAVQNVNNQDNKNYLG